MSAAPAEAMSGGASGIHSRGRSGGSRGGATLRPPAQRELYIDAFRGLMALAMVQGHVMDVLLTPEALTGRWYAFQQMFHGSTAPGFLFASGFVAGLPRAPLSLRASVRRARRLLFVLAVGYFLHLPFSSLWKTLAAATAAHRAALFACDALQVIAVTQLLVLVLQWAAGRRFAVVAGTLAVALIAATPAVWGSAWSASLPEWLRPYVDAAPGSRFPVFNYSAFVLAGTLAGAALGRVDPRRRRRRAIGWGLVLLALGALFQATLGGRFDFWSVSPAYALLRLGGLLLLLELVEVVARREGPGVRALALLGHETLLVYVLHLYLLFGGVFGSSPLMAVAGRLGYAAALGVVAAMVPVLLAAAWAWRQAKHRAPREAQLALVFLSVLFLYEFLTRGW